jgi:hypothetical protein
MSSHVLQARVLKSPGAPLHVRVVVSREKKNKFHLGLGLLKNLTQPEKIGLRNGLELPCCLAFIAATRRVGLLLGFDESSFWPVAEGQAAAVD